MDPNQVSHNYPPPGLGSGTWLPLPKNQPFGLSDGPHSWDLTWLLGKRNPHVPRATKSPRRITVKGHTYEYTECENLIMSSSGWPQRRCQLVHPLVTTGAMLPFLTHPDATPPVAVIPRASRDDLSCSFCGPSPVLHDTRAICPFHFYYLMGCRTQDVIRELDGFRDPYTGRYHYWEPEHVKWLLGHVSRCEALERRKREEEERLSPSPQTDETETNSPDSVSEEPEVDQ